MRTPPDLSVTLSVTLSVLCGSLIASSPGVDETGRTSEAHLSPIWSSVASKLLKPLTPLLASAAKAEKDLLRRVTVGAARTPAPY